MRHIFILGAAASLLAAGGLTGCPSRDPSSRTILATEQRGTVSHAPHDEAGHAEHDKAGHDEHGEGGHPPHDEGPAVAAGHGGHGHVSIVELGPEVLKEYGVEVGTAAPGKLEAFMVLPGEVSIDTDRVSHVVTPIRGVITGVHKNIGDSVKRGDLMLVLESTELAAAKSAYLQAVERLKLAQSTHEREESLWQQGVSAEQEYLAAKTAQAEAEIEVDRARQTLLALRVSQTEIDTLSGTSGPNLTRYSVYAPAGGIVVEKHASRGEMLTPDRDAFTLADLSTVWVRLSIHQRDLGKVKVGQQVEIDTPDGEGKVKAKVDFIEPVIGEESRQAVARVKLANPAGAWRPGLFVTGRVTVSAEGAAVLVPQDALQTVEGETVVFIEAEGHFVPRPVELGRQNETHAEVLSGLRAGEKYVTRNAFLVKAELGKATAEHSH